MMVCKIAMGMVKAVALVGLLVAGEHNAGAAISSAARPPCRRQLQAVPHRKKHAAPQVQQQANGFAAAGGNSAVLQAGAEQAQGALSDATDKLKGAKDDVHAAAKELDDIIKDIEDAQPTDSPFAHAKARYTAAKAAQKTALDSALAEYKQAVENLPDSTDDRVDQVSDLHDRLVTNNQDVRSAADEVASARPDYESLRDELLHKDQRWTDATKKLKEAKQAESDAQAALQNAARNNISAQSKLREAQALASHASVQAPKAGKHK